MTGEEIRPIAENYVEEYCHCSDGEYTDGSLVCAGIGTALIVSRQLEKRIAELEEAKANLEYLLEGRDNEIDELKKENKNLAQNLEDTEICENGWKNRVRELEAQIEKMKSQYNYAFNQLCESREIVCLMLSQYKNKKEIDYSTKERGEKLLKQGVYKYD